MILTFLFADALLSVTGFLPWVTLHCSAEFLTAIDLTVTLKLSYHLSGAFSHLSGRYSSWQFCKGETAFIRETTGIGSFIKHLKQPLFTFSWQGSFMVMWIMTVVSEKLSRAQLDPVLWQESEASGSVFALSDFDTGDCCSHPVTYQR